MLSLILKPLFSNSEAKIELPSDTEISLSMIESGCIFISLNQMAALIIIGTIDDIDLLKNINVVTFNFELIERPEFPSLGIQMEINTATGHPFKFDYFFNTESEAGLELLKQLRDQNYIDIHFYTTEIVHSKKIDIPEEDKIQLNALIDKVIT